MMDRRRSDRVDVPIHVSPSIVGGAALLNVSDGGFAVVSATRYDAGEHTFEFALSDTAFLTLRARAVHSVRVSGPGEPRYVTGFAFVNDENHADVLRLLGWITEQSRTPPE